MSTAREEYHIFQCGPVYIEKLIGGGQYMYIWIQNVNGEWTRAWKTPGAPRWDKLYNHTFLDDCRLEFWIISKQHVFFCLLIFFVCWVTYKKPSLGSYEFHWSSDGKAPWATFYVMCIACHGGLRLFCGSWGGKRFGSVAVATWASLEDIHSQSQALRDKGIVTTALNKNLHFVPNCLCAAKHEAGIARVGMRVKPSTGNCFQKVKELFMAIGLSVFWLVSSWFLSIVLDQTTNKTAKRQRQTAKRQNGKRQTAKRQTANGKRQTANAAYYVCTCVMFSL